MKRYCYIIMNNAGHSWSAQPNASLESTEGSNPSAPVLPQLLEEGWVPVRETPMGGGTSHLAHSLILLETEAKPAKGAKRKRA
jgi:hypothetical protein